MSKSSGTWLLAILSVLLVGPTLVCLVSRLVPLLIVAAVVIAALRVIWTRTDRW
jgi:hypothetical protein